MLVIKKIYFLFLLVVEAKARGLDPTHKFLCVGLTNFDSVL